MKKIFYIGLCLVVAFGEGGCTSRANGECDMSALVSCSFLYNNESEIQTCANKASDNACAVSALNPTNPNESVGSSYTCQEQSWTLAAIDAGHSVSYSDLSRTDVIFVDPSLNGNDVLNLINNPQDSNITYSLQSAVNLSKKEGLIVVCPGRYEETVTINSSVNDSLQIVNIAGGGEELAPYTIISSAGLGTPLTIENTVGVEIDGLTFEDGFASYGGGIAVSSSRTEVTLPTVSIFNSTLQNNSALLGGGLYIENKAIVNVENTHIDANSATSGGGIYISASSTPKNVTCTSCTLNDNEASLAGPAGFIEGGDTLSLIESQVQGNRSGTEGLALPAIYLAEDGKLLANNTDWGENTAENKDGDIINYIEAYEYQTIGTSEVITSRLMQLLVLLGNINDNQYPQINIHIDALSRSLRILVFTPDTFDANNANDLETDLEALENYLSSRNLFTTGISNNLENLRASLNSYRGNHGIYDYSATITSITCNTEEATCFLQ